ncbi:hypothetical protein HPB52_024078 [Rhipicephalus sanguineus]|uniref:HTH CENPB-type domain-containing protein n=1 Tax=Rhipicephalus sanguineus TaxID=34632 RepID=A0A9D4PQR6_RHISA|nr:hypothetical protein HPB52_024078 [Rhipicephalus sanguineus]
MDKGSSMLSSASRAPMKRGKYVTMSMAKKAAIVKLVESGRSRADVAKEFHISKQTLSDYIKNKQKILEAAEKSTGSRQKNVSQGTYPKLEEALLVWLKSTVASKVPVSGGLLKQKAEMMALQMNIEGFKVSDGWLRNFKKRSDLSLKKLGKAYSVDLLGALSMLADAWKSMTSTTLRNCFRHAGFVLNGESAALDEDSVVDQVSESEQLIDDLRTAGVEIPSDVSFSKFACVDSELELCAGLTNEEIIRQPTQAELMQALATLSSAYSDTTTLAEMRADVLTWKRNMTTESSGAFCE